MSIPFGGDTNIPHNQPLPGKVTPGNYLHLKRTVQVLRGAGVQLNPEDEKLIRQIEASLREYEEFLMRRNA